MRIKDVEGHVGITSKNIRFYEKEGLLSPERNSENHYREYSQEDVRRLKEIKLLRKLGISIENIRLLQADEVQLQDVLREQMGIFDCEIQNLMGAKGLCREISMKDISLKKMDVDGLLTVMSDMEGKGVRFMDIGYDEIIRYLPDRFKMQYYESIIKNGQVDNELLKKITCHIEEIYKKSIDSERVLVEILKNVDLEEKSKIIQLAKDNNPELYNRISKNIYSFEDIINVDREILKDILSQFDERSIVIASMGASPTVNEVLRDICPDIDFGEIRKEIGMLPLKTVENVHGNIIAAINKEI